MTDSGVDWARFAATAPMIADGGRQLFYQYGVGLGFLATVRPDGGPRLHPMCPFILDGRLVAFITVSPKRDDLLRDGRYAMHAFTPEDVDDEFMVAGRAVPVDDQGRRAAAVAAYHTRSRTSTGCSSSSSSGRSSSATRPAAPSRPTSAGAPATRARWNRTSRHHRRPDPSGSRSRPRTERAERPRRELSAHAD